MQKFCSTSEDYLTTFNFFHAAHHMNVPRLSPWKILVVSFYQFTTFFTQCGWELATEFSTTLKMAWLRFFFTHHQIPEGRGVAPFSVENFKFFTEYNVIQYNKAAVQFGPVDECIQQGGWQDRQWAQQTDMPWSQDSPGTCRALAVSQPCVAVPAGVAADTHRTYTGTIRMTEINW